MKKRTHHREYVLVLLYLTLKQDGLAAIVGEELVHCFGEIFECCASDSMYPHGFGKEDKVGVRHTCM